MPQFIGRHTIFHGFGRSPSETPPQAQPFTWWGSDRFRLPDGTRERNVRLQAEDGAFVLKPEPGAVVNIEGQTPQEHRLRNGDDFACGAAQLQFWIAPAPARSLTPVELSLWGLVASVVIAEVALLFLLR